MLWAEVSGMSSQAVSVQWYASLWLAGISQGI